jgi:hypothetical protein
MSQTVEQVSWGMDGMDVVLSTRAEKVKTQQQEEKSVRKEGVIIV